MLLVYFFIFFLVLNVATDYHLFLYIFRLMIMTVVLCGSYKKIVIIARSA